MLICPACQKFIDVNQNPNAPEDVQERLLLAPIEYNIAHSIASGAERSVPVYVNHFMQMVAYNQPVPNTGTYLLVPADVDSTWSAVYGTCLHNLKILNEKAGGNENFHYAGVAKILTALCLGIATDLWGDVPYSKAFQGSGEFTPEYDGQEDIYKTLQDLLDKGLADIAQNKGLKPAGDDYFYAGNMDKWTRLGYTLKARYYMHLTKAPGHNAAAQAELALTALQKGMAGQEDDLKFSYPGGAGTESQWYNDMLPVTTLVLSSAIVDTLTSRHDPRLPYLAAPAKLDGAYRGRPIGTVATGNLESYSLVGGFYANKNAGLYIVSWSEALFLKAEATLIRSGATAAQPFYEQGIRSHMDKLGVAAADVNGYLLARGSLTTQRALQQIMEEKSMAGFLSLENFTDWRRTGFPLLSKVPNALSDIPRRILYPQSEVSTNPQPQHRLKLTDRVWWDSK